MHKPKIFVGSSKESLKYAKAIKSKLQDVASVTVWNENLWTPGRAVLENLIGLVPKYDFAVLVLTADDLTASRGSLTQAPRDNLIFELGLFMGHLGRFRTFFLCDPGNGDFKLPSDLEGIIYIPFTARPGQERSAILNACKTIRNEIRSQGVLKLFQSEAMVNRIRMSSWEDIYSRATKLVTQAESKVRGTSFGTFSELQGAKLNYFEGIAQRAAERQGKRRDFMYKVVCSKNRPGGERDVALRNRKDIFEKFGVFDCLSAREIESSWGVDFLMVDEKHLHVSFQRQGNNSLGLGLELMDAEELVRPIVRWYDDCLFEKATPIDWDSL